MEATKVLCAMCQARDMVAAMPREGTPFMICPNCDRPERCADPDCDSPACAEATSMTTARCKVYDGTGPTHNRP